MVYVHGLHMPLYCFPRTVLFHWNFRSAFLSLFLKFRLKMLGNMSPGALLTECIDIQKCHIFKVT